MATDAGKTFTACTFSERLLAHGKFKRILFLPTAPTLCGRRVMNFWPTAGTEHSFTELYNVQKLGSAELDASAAVVISGIT
jgi:type I restriction enzyme R subunit